MKNAVMLDRGRQGPMGNHGEIFRRKTTGRRPTYSRWFFLSRACLRAVSNVLIPVRTPTSLDTPSNSFKHNSRMDTASPLRGSFTSSAYRFCYTKFLKMIEANSEDRYSRTPGSVAICVCIHKRIKPASYLDFIVEVVAKSTAIYPQMLPQRLIKCKSQNAINRRRKADQAHFCQSVETGSIFNLLCD
ncbi:hypothetical protein [Paenibacillus sp. TH7-28]